MLLIPCFDRFSQNHKPTNATHTHTHKHKARVT